MNRRAVKLVVLAYLVAFAATTLVAFRVGGSVPPATGYLLLFVLYALPVLALLRYRLPAPLLAGFLLATTGLSMLIVIDPLEVGYYGYDPYQYTLPVLQTFPTASISTIMNVEHAWPGFYAFTRALLALPGGIDRYGKYVPLFIAGAPVLLFVAVRRLTDVRVAFLAATGTAALRTLLMFESKFLDETLAAFLFFVLVAVVVLLRANRRLALAVVVITALQLAHHATSFLVVLFLAVWYLGSYLSRFDVLPTRLHPVPDGLNPSVLLPLYAAAVLAFTLAVLAPQFTVTQYSLLYRSIVFGQTTAVSSAGSAVPTSGSEGVLAQLGSVLTVVVLAVLAGIGGAGVLSRYRTTAWETGWIVFSGVLSVQYAVTLLAGRVVPLDPIRLLTYFVPALLAASLTVLTQSMWTPSVSLPDRYVIGTVVVLVFVVTQLLTLPPHVVYTDPSETTLGEGHYTPVQFRTSSWVAAYSNTTIHAYESGLWAARGTRTTLSITDTDDCRVGFLVWRTEVPVRRPANLAPIYDAGSIALYACDIQRRVPARVQLSHSSR